MRTHAIACAAISIVAGCSAELTERPPASDPTGVAAPEAPSHRPPPYEPDPLLSPAPPRNPEPPLGQVYTCPMHPAVRESRPGKCPKCGMTLLPKGGGE